MTGAGGAPLLVAAHVTRRFGAFTAVDDVTMHVAPGEVVGLLGANGAGKTTLIRMLLGLIAATEGEVSVLGGPPDRERRSRVGYVPQGLGLYRDLTVAENLAFSTGAYDAPVPTLPPTLQEVSDRLVGELPLGLQRRLAFVAALAHSPAVLVLDEPTSGVDPLARASLWDTVHEQADAGVGVLVTTHSLQEADQCDRLLLMAASRLVAQGSVADIVGTTTAVAVRTDDWAAAFTALDRAGAPVTLDGRRVRVADESPQTVARVLADAGLEAEVEAVPATIEERMTVLAREGRG